MNQQTYSEESPKPQRARSKSAEVRGEDIISRRRHDHDEQEHEQGVLVSCPANSRHKSVIPTGAKRSGRTLCFKSVIPTGAKWSGGTLCFKSVIPTGAKWSGGTLCFKSVIPTGAKRSGRTLCFQFVIPTGAKRSEGTLCFQRPALFTQDFRYAFISGTSHQKSSENPAEGSQRWSDGRPRPSTCVVDQLFSNAVANASSDSDRSRLRRIPRSTSARRSAA